MSGIERVTEVPALPPRPAEGHKGMFGRVLVVGGSADMIGAPVLAATAALRMGSGLVQIAVPQSVLAASLSITPELIGIGLGKRDKALLEAAKKADALVLGPGLGQDKDVGTRLAKLIRLDKPAVLDADALNWLASRKKWPKEMNLSAVLTPHPGEMKRLAKLIGRDSVPGDEAGRIDIAVELARHTHQVVALKGHGTVVTDGQRVYVNRTGDSALSKAGSGDVLCGILGCLLGQGMNAFDAACLGTCLHGRAGEAAGQRLGRRSVLARDVIDALPQAIQQHDAKG